MSFEISIVQILSTEIPKEIIIAVHFEVPSQRLCKLSLHCTLW